MANLIGSWCVRAFWHQLGTIPCPIPPIIAASSCCSVCNKKGTVSPKPCLSKCDDRSNTTNVMLSEA